MTRLVFTFWIVSLLVVGVSCSRERMTPAKFDEIVAAPGDDTPLTPEMKAVPYWTNFEAEVDLKYQDGRNLTEHLVVTGKTVRGQYIVHTINSKSYKQPVSTIIGYDPRTATYQTWSESRKPDGSGNMIYVGTGRLNPQEKTYTTFASYDGITEVGNGVFSDSEDRSQTLFYKNGALFLTREVVSKRSGN